jgi:hypothetical protein
MLNPNSGSFSTTVTAENLCVKPPDGKCWFCATGSGSQYMNQAHTQAQRHRGEPVCDPCARLLGGFLAWLGR